VGTIGRVALVVFGLLVILVGLGAWSIEGEYGSGLNFSVESRSGTATVFEERGPKLVPVFEGTQEEASTYMGQRRSQGESFVGPGIIIAVGIVLVVVAFVLRRRTVDDGDRSLSSARTREDARAAKGSGL
jgi:hypothetical protein